jgi:transglutaminase-like putative cysteine protease/tetratricopeptide (TPR) repeat protein
VFTLVLTTTVAAAPRRSQIDLRQRSQQLRRLGHTPRGVVALVGLDSLVEQLPRGVMARFLKQSARRRLHPLVRDWLGLLALDQALDRGRTARATALRAKLGIVQTFAVVGPFENEGGVGFAKRYKPELRSDVARLPKRSFVGKAAVVRWRPMDRIFPDGRIRIIGLLRPRAKGVAYLRVDLDASRAQVAALRLGTNCAYRIWLNGQLVASRNLRRPLRPDQDSVGVRLRRGRNPLLIKLAAEGVPAELLLRVTGSRGGSLSTVRARPPRFAKGRGGGGVIVFSRQGPPKVGPAVVAVGAFLEALRKKRPQDTAVLSDLVRYHLRISPGDPRKRRARRLALALVKAHPSVGAHRLLAQTSTDGNDQRRGLVAALKLAPQDSQALDGMGDFYYSAGRHHLAQRYWERAKRAAPNLVRVRIKLAELHQLRRMPSLARAALRRLARRYPRSDDVLRALASLEAGRGHVAVAVKMLTRYAGRHRRDLAALTLLTSLEQRRLRPKAASKWLRWQVRAWPHRLRPLLALARNLAANGKAPSALGLLQRASVRLPRSFALAEALGHTALTAGMISAAKGHLRRAATLRPQSLRVKQLLAHLERKGPDPLVQRYARNGRTMARAAWKRKVSSTDALVLLDSTAYQVQSSGLSRKFHQQLIQINNTKGVARYKTHRVDYLPDTQHLEVLVARVIRPDGSEQEGNQRDVQLSDPAIRMYYDRRLKVIHFASVRPGDVIELQTVLSDTPANNMFKDYFGTLHPLQGSSPIRKLQLVIELSAGRSIRFSKPRLKGLKHQQKKKSKQTIHRWTAENVPAVHAEPQMPGWAETYAHLHVSTFRKWTDVARWYWGLVKGQYHADTALRRAARQATKGMRTLRDKVVAIYNLVVKKTRYVALAFGVHTYKPYTAPSVFARKFGDCKDKAMLMAVMLGEVGVKAHPVLVRTRRGGRISPKIPSLAPFDHAILYVPGLKLWLDGTAERTGAADLPHADQGQMALIIDGKDGRLVTTPVLPARANRTQRKLHLQMSGNGDARVSETWIIRGQEAAWWRRRFADPALRKNHYGKLISQTFPRARIGSITLSDPDALEKAVTVTATYRVPGLGQVRGRRLTLDLTLSAQSMTSRFAPLSRRKLPLEYAYPWSTDTEVTLTWPRTHRLVAGPTPARWVGLGGKPAPRLSFVQTLSRRPGGLVLRRQLGVRGHRFDPKQYRAVRTFWLDVDKSVSKRLVLQKGGRP